MVHVEGPVVSVNAPGTAGRQATCCPSFHITLNQLALFVSHCAGGDRPYLVSGADDRLVKVWDYQTKACIQVRWGY